LTGLNVVATTGFNALHAADTRPTVALPINCMDSQAALLRIF
jgi:hypothetical protein